MYEITFLSPDWYRALTLRERGQRLPKPRLLLKEDIDKERSQRRLQRWRSQPPFAANGYFEQRLSSANVTEEDLFYLLGDPENIKYGNQMPAWLVTLAQAFEQPAVPWSRPYPEALREHKVDGFMNLVAPLLAEAERRLQAGIQAITQQYTGLPLAANDTAELLLMNLPAELTGLLVRTLVLELHVNALQGQLDGRTPEERFASFGQRLAQPDVAVSILREYPVLARQLTIRIENWVAFNLAFLNRLAADWPRIKANLCPADDPGLLVAANRTGDRHRGGQSVMVLRFESGFQLVYKPKSLAVDQHFQALLTWLNERGANPPFRIVQTIDCGTYGWVEFVKAEACRQPEAVTRFYQRQGGYLALLYALCATDFHYENLIAAGEHPVLVDLESICQPRIGGSEIRDAFHQAGQAMGSSVLQVGLLPQRIWSDETYEGVDVSGLGNTAGQLTPHPIPYLEEPGTDQARFARRRMEMLPGQNRPQLNGTDVHVLDYTEAIIAGFDHIYRLLMECREELLAAAGPINAFAEDEIRVILRPTRSYALMLQESFHPDLLRDALDRERFFDRLWIGIEHRPYMARVIPGEQAQLQQGDIPLFTTHVNSCDLYGTSTRLPDFLEETGLAQVRHRLRQLSEQDLAQQTWFIRASLTALSLGVDSDDMLSYRVRAAEVRADRARLLHAAEKVGERLAFLAVRGEQDTIWIGLVSPFERHWKLMPLGSALYDGLSGIILFLAYLGALTEKSGYTHLAQQGLATLQRQIEPTHLASGAIGGFNGLGGTIYVLMQLGMLWDKPDLLAQAMALVERLPAMIEKQTAFDVLNGMAGCIGALLSLHQVNPSTRLLDIAHQCGHRLISLGQPAGSGVGWLSGAASKPLTGFSHGTAGVAWALLKLFAATEETSFRETAQAAIAYERSTFSPEMANWPDLREFEAPGRRRDNSKAYFMSAWCHGAMGIGLSRLQMLKHLDDSQLQAEIEVAIQTTLAQGFGGNHSLCHGDLGNLELLLQAGNTLNDSHWRDKAYCLATGILESIETHGWLCGVPRGIETPGLMTGLAGIGYGLLRLVAPAQVPSVLLLEPPR